MNKRAINTTPKETIAVLFDMGPVRVTAEVKATLRPKEISMAFGRHVSGDWGHMTWKDERANFTAAQVGFGGIVSVFNDYGQAALVVKTLRSPKPSTIMAFGAKLKETG